jgi:hypothetical protein
MSGNQLSFARRTQGVLSRIVPDRRRHKRVSVTMLGRFMRENKQEYPCRLLDISVGGAAVMSPVTVDLGERVGEPSRWITLRALRVLRWAGRVDRLL